MTRHNHKRRREARAHMAEHGGSYTEALRETSATAPTSTIAPGDTYTSPFKVRPVEQGGPELPAVPTRQNDVNYACGHWLGNKCDGCGVCTTCDGCYCAELRQEAADEAYYRRVQRDHMEHWDEPDKDCDQCEHDRRRSNNFTECPKCGKGLLGLWHFREHNPPYCMRDHPHPRGLDWSHLIGKRVTIDTHWLDEGSDTNYGAAWTGTVLGKYTNPSTGRETTHYELELDHTVPQPRTDLTTTRFDPREFTITENGVLITGTRIADATAGRTAGQS